MNDSTYKPRLNLLVQTYGSERIKFDEKLSYHTFSKVGGPAEAFFIATSQKELISILDSALELKIPYFIFGSGTKILISDQGINGLVIKNRTGNIKIGGIKGKVGRAGIGIEEALIEVDSGVSINKMNEFLKQQNLKPFEGMSSTSATVGGAILLDELLQAMATNVKVWENGGVFDIDLSELKRNAHIILSVVFKVKAGI
jgi:UDP-N-acetylmuramate dehydrogenase